MKANPSHEFRNGHICQAILALESSRCPVGRDAALADIETLIDSYAAKHARLVIDRFANTVDAATDSLREISVKDVGR